MCWKPRKVSRATSRTRDGDNAPGEADDQQGSRMPELSSGVLTPQRLHAELLGSTLRETRQEREAMIARIATRDQDEDIVRAPWRHGGTREQGSRTGRCGWITSFLRSLGTPS
jgi:hypothetical protein